MMIKKLSVVLCACLLSACGNSGYNDLQKWMDDKTKMEKGRINPLPKAKTFVSIPFVAKTDPFQERINVAVSVGKNKFAPDLNRRKEPLENYTLAQLKMVGLVIKDKVRYAMIKVPVGTINYVKVGDYMGPNYGKIIKLEDEKITLEERIKNSADEWEPKETIVTLTEAGDKDSNSPNQVSK